LRLGRLQKPHSEPEKFLLLVASTMERGLLLTGKWKNVRGWKRKEKKNLRGSEGLVWGGEPALGGNQQIGAIKLSVFSISLLQEGGNARSRGRERKRRISGVRSSLSPSKTGSKGQKGAKGLGKRARRTGGGVPITNRISN